MRLQIAFAVYTAVRKNAAICFQQPLYRIIFLTSLNDLVTDK